jgi:3-oxoacyl-[acyl-carrier-protein] synthase-3
MLWSSLVQLSQGPHSAIPRPGLRCSVVAGTGSALPARALHNDHFPPELDTSDEWIRTRTGIRERRVAGAGESSFTLAVKAGRQALAASGLMPEEIDLIICATVTPETMVPSNACRLQAALGCRHIGAFDLSGACTGFVQALSVASQFLATGACQNVLVVGTEVLTRTLDYTDRTSCILFGDGAGAMILSGSAEAERGLLWVQLYSDGEKGELIYMPSQVTHVAPPLTGGAEEVAGPRFTRLNGREVFKFAVRAMVSLIQEALEVTKAAPERLLLVPHQVNGRIIDAALEGLPIRRERVVVNLERYGNTSAASIPIALDEAIRSGVAKPGDDVLLVAFGGGMTSGGALLRL